LKHLRKFPILLEKEVKWGMGVRYLRLKLNSTKFMMTHLQPHTSDPAEHDHGDDYQITIPISGTPFLELNKKSNLLNKNIRMITSPGEKHFHFTKEEESRILLININKQLINQVLTTRLTKEFREIDFRIYGEGHSEKLMKIADELIRANLLLAPDPIRNEELEWELAETLLSIQEGTHSEQWRKDVTLQFHPLIQKVVHYIEENFQMELSLDDLTRESNLSKFYLIRSFKEVMGFTPAQFISETRLKHALHLLLTTNLDITTICFEAGFGSLHTFERAFKRKFGVTISDFRKKNER
jgi:AraC-like DNA-binding protein